MVIGLNLTMVLALTTEGNDIFIGVMFLGGVEQDEHIVGEGISSHRRACAYCIIFKVVPIIVGLHIPTQDSHAPTHKLPNGGSEQKFLPRAARQRDHNMHWQSSHFAEALRMQSYKSLSDREN